MWANRKSISGLYNNLHKLSKLLLWPFSLICLIFIVLFFSFRQPSLTENWRSVFLDIATPVLEFISQVRSSVVGIFAEPQNQAMQRMHYQITELQNKAAYLLSENKELKKQLRLIDSKFEVLLTARVITFPTEPFAHSIVINMGSRHGIAKNQVVTTHEGLVGRIIEVGEKSARVLLITNANSRIPVLIEHERKQAILTGNNSQTMELAYFQEESLSPKKVRIVTSGKGGIFPPGVIIGTIQAGSNVVVPAVSYKHLEFVQVLKQIQ